MNGPNFTGQNTPGISGTEVFVGVSVDQVNPGINTAQGITPLGTAGDYSNETRLTLNPANAAQVLFGYQFSLVYPSGMGGSFFSNLGRQMLSFLLNGTTLFTINLMPKLMGWRHPPGSPIDFVTMITNCTSGTGAVAPLAANIPYFVFPWNTYNSGSTPPGNPNPFVDSGTLETNAIFPWKSPMVVWPPVTIIDFHLLNAFNAQMSLYPLNFAFDTIIATQSLTWTGSGFGTLYTQLLTLAV